MGYGMGERGKGKRSAGLEERPARRDLRLKAKRDVGFRQKQRAESKELIAQFLTIFNSFL